ncbi:MULTISPECIES: hypothetical protein [Saccharothrix]|uniref:hypothetical protein n=1 Tax=Saccharothrix TaxID=2071 RepID=UPI00093B3666|nr:hypothetical protein [Saccharothrix sp. CB00851]OKI26268.1 hypothetical protein A6A25_31695 [Saccharothrix sp. CB00851]
MQFARVGALVGAVTAAVAATVFTAGPAFAHTPNLTAKCEDGTTTLSVKLTAYAESSQGKTNHITVSLDGKELENKDFGRSFEGSYSASGDAKRVFVVKVTAHDGDQYSFEKTKTVEACVVPTTTTTTTTTTAETTSIPTSAPSTTTLPPDTTEPPAQSSVPATTTTTTTPAVVAVGDTGDGLANTGASIAIPLVIGAVLLGGGAALLIVLRRRAAND